MIKTMSNELKNKALRWYVRMRSPDADDDERQAFESWLMENTMHKEAYNAIEREWQELDDLDSWAKSELHILEKHMVQDENKHNNLFRVTGLAIATAMALVLLAYILVINQPEVHEYKTEKGEQLKLVLEDGSRIHLNSASSIDVRFNSEAREIHIFEGEGLFDVAPERNRPFVVTVGKSKIVAVGTSFSVYYKKGEFDVTVLEGRVAIVPADMKPEKMATTSLIEIDHASLLLEPDQQAYVNKQGQIAEVKIVDADNITAWNRGLIVFDGTPLRTVVKELSRYTIAQIRVADNVPDHPVTGVIKIRDQETMLKLLAEVIPVTPVKQSSQLVLLYPSHKELNFGNSK